MAAAAAGTAQPVTKTNTHRIPAAIYFIKKLCILIHRILFSLKRSSFAVLYTLEF